MLQTLKRYVKSPEQQSRIDSLCLLLERKELLLDTVMDTFERLRKTGKIVNRRIPAIVSRIRQADVLPAEKKKEEETPKKGFWSFIRPERKNRPICSRRNSWNAGDSPVVNIRAPHQS